MYIPDAVMDEYQARIAAYDDGPSRGGGTGAPERAPFAVHTETVLPEETWKGPVWGKSHVERGDVTGHLQDNDFIDQVMAENEEQRMAAATSSSSEDDMSRDWAAATALAATSPDDTTKAGEAGAVEGWHGKVQAKCYVGRERAPIVYCHGDDDEQTGLSALVATEVDQVDQVDQVDSESMDDWEVNDAVSGSEEEVQMPGEKKVKDSAVKGEKATGPSGASKQGQRMVSPGRPQYVAQHERQDAAYLEWSASVKSKYPRKRAVKKEKPVPDGKLGRRAMRRAVAEARAAGMAEGDIEKLKKARAKPRVRAVARPKVCATTDQDGEDLDGGVGTGSGKGGGGGGGGVSSSAADGARVMTAAMRREDVSTMKHVKNRDKSDRATVDTVLDRKTNMVIVSMMNRGLFKGVYGCISAGKEANVYYCETKEGVPLALKVYKTSILVFKDRERYMMGEYRFRNSAYSRKNPRSMVKRWADKERRNLERLRSAGIPAPRVICLKRNVLLMEFIGTTPAEERALLEERQKEEDKLRRKKERAEKRARKEEKRRKKEEKKRAEGQTPGEGQEEGGHDDEGDEVTGAMEAGVARLTAAGTARDGGEAENKNTVESGDIVDREEGDKEKDKKKGGKKEKKEKKAKKEKEDKKATKGQDCDKEDRDGSDVQAASSGIEVDTRVKAAGDGDTVAMETNPADTVIQMGSLDEAAPLNVSAAQPIVRRNSAGENEVIGMAAPRLRNAAMSARRWRLAYIQSIKLIRILFHSCRLVHGDLSQYNILYHDNMVWIIDVSQSMECDHIMALDFLRADCRNVSQFFASRGVAALSVKRLFQFVVRRDVIDLEAHIESILKVAEEELVLLANDNALRSKAEKEEAVFMGYVSYCVRF